MTPPGASQGTGVRLRLFLLLLLAAAFLHPGTVDNIDSRIILRTATQVVDHGTWSLGDVAGTKMASPEYGGLGTNGEHQMKFGVGNALLDVPFVIAGRAVLVPLGLDAARAGEAAAAFASCLWWALAGVVLHRVLRRFTDPAGATLGVLVWAFATYAVVYARSSYLEGPLTLAVLFAYERALRSRETQGAWGPAAGLGAACAAVLLLKIAAVTALAGLPAVLLLGPGASPANAVRATLRAAVPFGVGAAFLCATNYFRFGDPFESGYAASARFDHPLAHGVVALLFGDRGLLTHAPLALLGLAALPALASKDRGLAWGTGLALVPPLVMYAVFFSPFGGDAWGPRYLLPNAALLAVPAGFALPRMLRAGGANRFAAALVIGVGLTLQVAPCMLSFRDHWSQRERGADDAAPGPTLARMAFAKAGSDDGMWSTADVGLTGPPARLPAPAWDLWPVRVAKDLPRHADAAWTAWAAVLFGAIGAAVSLARSVGRGATPKSRPS